ncbi:MAG TPA: hypothetical protein VFK06_17935 [Candidatus Angelobacter sp.]|nr:hypothetical protein [Candidatus Angelobacter sp.]
MKLMFLAPLLFALYLQAGLSQAVENAGASCIIVPKDVEALIHDDLHAQNASLQVTPLPALRQAFTALQVSASSVYPAAVRQIEFCEITVSMFDVRDGHVAGTTLFVDRDPPKWLMGIAPDGRTFLLAGFSDPEKGFNELIGAVGLQVKSPDLASDVADFYLRMTGGEDLRESVVVDEMQLQSAALMDFRNRYSLAQARTLYARWWAGISPALKKALHRPKTTAENSEFETQFFRYQYGQVLEETIAISRDGAVMPRATRALYTFSAR